MLFYVRVTNPKGCQLTDGTFSLLNHRLLFDDKQGLLSYDGQLFDCTVRDRQLTKEQSLQLLKLIFTAPSGSFCDITWQREL